MHLLSFQNSMSILGAFYQTFFIDEMLPEILKEKKEIKVYEELQKGSEKLRQEATLNLQRYGGNFIPDFYGGKARMRFGWNEDQVSE